MRKSVIDAIGDTPLVRLSRLLPDAGFELFAKLEALNPGGSAKDRPARKILQDAIETGAIGPATVVIESSSGNMGVGLAQVCAYLGLRFICVVDPRAAPRNLQVLQAYGAEIERVEEPDPETGEFLQARLERVRQLLTEIEPSFWPNQYANRSNARAHYETTMREIVEELGGGLDYLFCPVSTCGTLRGCVEFLREQGLKTRVIAVDADGSLIFGERRKPRLIPGMGAGLRPQLCDPDLFDQCVHVSDLECVVGCRRLVQREAILAGGSSGGVVMAVDRLKSDIPRGASCVVILPDRGERYLETVYSDEWVRQHLGEIEHLWRGEATEGAPLRP